MNYSKLVKAFLVFIFFIFVSIFLKYSFNYFKDITNVRYHDLLKLLSKIVTLSIIFIFIYYEKIETKSFLKNNLIYFSVFIILSYLIFYNTNQVIISKNYNVDNEFHLFYYFRYLLVGATEEGLFRVLIFWLVYNSFSKNNSNSLFKSIILTSFLFGIIHILNITEYEDLFSVINQIILALSIGIIFQVVLIRTNSYIVVLFLHGIFDYYGKRRSGLFKIKPQDNSGFTTTEVIVNISVFVLIALFLTFLCYRFCKKQYQRAEVFREQEIINP